MKTPKYVKLKIAGGGSYIQPYAELKTAIDGELNAISNGERVTITFSASNITDEEYEKLPEFCGH